MCVGVALRCGVGAVQPWLHGRLFYQQYANVSEDVVFASLLPLGANVVVVDFVPCDGKVWPAPVHTRLHLPISCLADTSLAFSRP